MRRRELIAVLVGTATASMVRSRSLGAQQRSKLPVVGIVASREVPQETDAFLAAMRDLGYVEDRNISYAWRSSSGKPESFARLARDLVGLKPDVIVTAGGLPVVRAVMEATSTIPVVFAVLGDAVEDGVVSSLAHPSGNVTGLSFQNTQLGTKRLQLLHETLPKIRRIAVFWEPTTPQYYRDATKGAGRALGVELQLLEIAGPEAFDGAFEAAVAAGAGAVTTASGRIVTPNREKFLALAARYRLPAMYHQSVLSRAGGLMSYGPNFPDLWRRSATYVDKILKGAKPGDLPVEQPVKFEFVINLKTAKALGLEIPAAILDRADEVIE